MSAGEQEHEAAFAAWNLEWLRAQYPFYNDQAIREMTLLYGDAGRRQAYDAGYQRGLEMRGCCEEEEITIVRCRCGGSMRCIGTTPHVAELDYFWLRHQREGCGPV